MIPYSAKYQPYDALRQRLWSQLLKQYDSDDTRTISHIELTSMLDSLGSTLSTETIDTFFIRWGKNPRTDELTIPEAIQCLEAQIYRPTSEKKRIPPSESEGRERELGTGTENSTPHTPNLNADAQTLPLRLDSLSFSGPELRINDVSSPTHRLSVPRTTYSTEARATDYVQSDEGVTSASGPHPQPVQDPSTPPSLMSYAENTGSGSGSGASSNGNGNDNGAGSGNEEAFERVINIKNCPLCQRPRLNSKAERDIVTHLAVCASQDWARVDRVMVANFVTPVQAQRKWYTNVLSKVSAGNYKLGAVCHSASVSYSFKLKRGIEFRKHHRAESDDWPVGGGKDASLRATRHSPAIQGM
jgi:phosphatidylserine decarboxylase